jgi:hypothetical protein
MRLFNAPLWSGIMTSHSCKGADEDAIVRAKLCARRDTRRVVGTELRARVRRANIRYGGAIGRVSFLFFKVSGHEKAYSVG